MQIFFVVMALLFASPAVAENKVVLDPRVSQPNLFAPNCKIVKDQWQSVKKAEKGDPARIGYFVRYLRYDLERCKYSPKAVGETPANLLAYERAYKKLVEEHARK
jgi:hypothetical protein